MIVIPSDQISKPGLHADGLGYTFVWNHHFLRGIYPAAVEQAKAYFESGFVDEIVSKKLFPKTWISDFENEQFGMIIEHEMITPVLYATEWNFAMLKDAALMVLEIAQTGWKYGYNMVDCHKLNVLFQDNRPVYVDLGSFIPREEGSTGWNPYFSYLRSYYYILSVWSDGATTLAKRMMAPGLEFSAQDYYIYKSRFYRAFPHLIKRKQLLQEGLCRLAVWGKGNMARRGTPMKLAKWLVDRIKPSRSQRLDSIRRKVKSLSIRPVMGNPKGILNCDSLVDLVNLHCTDCHSVTFINNPCFDYYPLLAQNTELKTMVSVQEDDALSCSEYGRSKQSGIHLCCTSFKLLNNTILVRGKYPETRLRSDLAIATVPWEGKESFRAHNAFVFIEHCLLFAEKELLVMLPGSDEELEQLLSSKYKIESFPPDGLLIIHKYQLCKQNKE